MAFLVLAGCSVPLKLASDGGTGGGGGGGGGDGGGGGGDGTGDAPVVTLTGQPAALGNQTSVTFTFTVSEPATVECRLDSNPYTTCPPPSVMFPTLADGMHTFDLRATANGAEGSIPTYSFAIDTAPPVVAITGQPASASPVAAGDFQFTIGDAVSATCALDSATPQACTSPFAYSGLADGAHTFSLVATDAAGNPTTKTYSWTVQTTPPSLAITSEPPSLSAVAMGQFQFTTGSSVTVTCQIDSGTATACTSPYAYSGLADGSHTFTLTGTDAANNVTTKTYTWTIDTTPPTLAITGEPANPTNATGATFTFTIGDSQTATCQLDGNGAAPCSSTEIYSGLIPGTHAFTLRGTDAAGNTATQIYNWVIDVTAPTVMITAKPADPSTTRAGSVSFTVSDGTPTCKLNGASYVACSSPWSFTSTTDGTNTVTVHSTDGAGNVGAAAYSWTIDTVAPTVTLAAVDYSGCPSTAYISWSDSDATTGIASCTCGYTGVTAFDCTTQTSYAATIPLSGSKTFTIRCTDGAGNMSVLKSATVNMAACP